MTDTNVYAEPSPPAAAATTTTPPATTPGTTTSTTASSTQATAGTTPTPTAITIEDRPKDPRIASLHALFPDYDDLILYSVLDSVNGDQDRAIDALLRMSDPDYKGEPVAPQQPALSQTELDEQFARRLLLEEQDAWIAQQEEREYRRPQFAQRQQQQQQQQQQQGQQQGQGSTGDTMAELQQQIGKFAETGKKTFNTFFSKVKAKIQEMDQPRTAQSSTYDPGQYERRTSQVQPSSTVPYATRPRTQAPAPAPAPVLPPAQQPAYYDPNAREASLPNMLGLSQMQGYDVTPVPKPEAVTPPKNAPPGTTSGSSTPPLNDTPQRTLTSPPIDGGKYGLLPKRPVTLLRPAESTQLQRQHSMDDSDDGLEYAENPFEEGKK